MASHDTSRKKRKVSHMDGRTSHQDMPPVVAASSALPTPPGTTAAMDHKHANAPCHHEQSLKTLHTDLDAMRHLITCKICDRFLYEPYALSCGHTYCYSCLTQWLGSNAKMTCPDCRTVIRQQPTPSYLIRELVLIFISRNELLPDGETVDEHDKLVKEEGEIVSKDKANTDQRSGGLFKGRFNKLRFNHLREPLYDPGDGVARCPECHWELEAGHCDSCGYEADDASGAESFLSDSEDDEVDLDLRDIDEDGLGLDGEEFDFDAQYLRERYGDPNGGLPGGWPRSPIDLDGTSDDDSEADEYDQNDTFIDDDAIDGSEGSDQSEAESDVTAGRPAPAARPAPAGRPRYGRSRGPVVISDDEDDEPEFATTGGAVEVSSASADEYEDSEDQGPVARGSQRIKRPSVAVRPRRALTVSSDDEGESEDSREDGESEINAPGGFSPIDDGSEAHESEHTDYDDFHGGAADGFGGDTFNPEDASLGGYEDESDESDGWGTTTTINSRARPSRLAPSTRLGTLQQRRPRHVSPYQRPAPALSPTAAARSRVPSHSALQRPSYQAVPPGFRVTNRDFPDVMRHTNAAPTRAPPQLRPQPAHPFHLDNVLTRINSDTLRPRTNGAAVGGGSTYNQRTQQALSARPAFPPPVASATRNYTDPGRSWQHAGSGAAGGGEGAGARRKRAMSVQTDDSQECYV